MNTQSREQLICSSSDLVNGGIGVRFEVPWLGGTNAPAFVIRYNDRVHAYLNRCAHVPVEMDWEHGQFFDHSQLYLICATHGALYAPENGRCMGGKCNGKGLVAVDITERDGAVYFIKKIENNVR